MKNTGLIVAILLGLAGRLPAQVDVEVVTDQNQFLPGERIPVSVRIINHSGQTLRFGKEDWLSFSIESADGTIVDKAGDPPAGHEFELETSKVATQRTDLGPYFKIVKSGSYTLTATIKLKDWGLEATSKPKGFYVIQGYKMWEQPFGLPLAAGANREQPEVRKYILQKATYLQHLKLYLRVTDASESIVFRVVPVGTLVSYSNPQMLLDQRNNLHLLYAEGARAFSYSVFNPDGELLGRQSYYYTEGPPRLKMDASGKIAVAGGMRRAAATDFPPMAANTSNAPVAPVR